MTVRRHKGPIALADPPGTRTYVLDTSAVLSDPAALGAFGRHEVVLPLTVITELETKRHHPELG
ncbi:MAG: PIN domain-containing protein, partial [Actinomycetota bacterium]|nr:PIN domain-containing protein [Actinomycetota bacterium]